MNQFSNTQQSITTAGYDELRRTSITINLSPISILQMPDALLEAKCSSCLVAGFCVPSVESLKGIRGEEE